MKTINKAKVAMLGLMLTAGTVSAQFTPQTFTSTNAAGAVIMGGNPAGLSQTLDVNTAMGTIQSITISLNLGGGYNGALYATLTAPNGDKAILLNRSGVGGSDAFGYSDTGFNITLNYGGSDIHSYQSGAYSLNGNGQLTGIWAADGENVPPNSSPGVYDATAATAGLNLFTGDSLNGEWTLFVANVTSGSPNGTLDGWGMTVTAVPEPGTLALAAIGGVGAFFFARRRK